MFDAPRERPRCCSGTSISTGLSNQLFAGVPEHSLQLSVGLGDASLGVADQDAGRRGFDQKPEAVFGLLAMFHFPFQSCRVLLNFVVAQNILVGDGQLRRDGGEKTFIFRTKFRAADFVGDVNQAIVTRSGLDGRAEEAVDRGVIGGKHQT